MTAIAVGGDAAGARLAGLIAEHLRHVGADVVEFREHAGEGYPDVAVAVARRVASGDFDRAVLVCGTGIGMSIAANKVPGVYAALCHDTYSAERSRLSNNAQVLAMGARVIGDELAKRIVDVWLAHDYHEGPSTPKLRRLVELERDLAGG